MQLLKNPRAVVASTPLSASQISPRPKRDVVIAGALGVVLALALAFFLEALDTRLRSADELVGRLGMPLLGRTLPISKRTGAAGLLPTVYDPAGIQAEAYRMVRLNVEFANLQPNFRLFMVTSALSGEGKTVTAANLAVSFARADRNVLLIDLDLRRPSMHDIFGVDPTPGVTDVALGRVALDDAVLHGVLRGRNEIKPKVGEGERKPQGSLALLTAGVGVPDPGTFVETDALIHLLAEVQKTYEIVLIDTPPLLSVGDGLALGGVVDAALVVSGSGRLKKSEAREFSQALEAIRALKLGLIVTGVEAARSTYYATHPERDDQVTPLHVPLPAHQWGRPAQRDV